VAVVVWVVGGALGEELNEMSPVIRDCHKASYASESRDRRHVSQPPKRLFLRL